MIQQPTTSSVESDGAEIGLSDCSYLNAKGNKNQSGVVLPSKNPTKNKRLEVKGIEVYRSTVKVKHHSQLPHDHEHKRNAITELSKKSLERLAFVVFNTEVDFCSMLTLTYAGIPTDGLEVKKDLNRFLTWLRRNYPGVKYLWFLEFQQRGSPHYHILTDVNLAHLGGLEAEPYTGEAGRIDPSGKRLARVRRSNGKYWRTHWETHINSQDAWGLGWTAWEVMEEKDGGKRYAAKYATKAYQKAVPEEYQNVGRFWGYSRDGVKPEPEGFYRCNEQMLREALEAGGWEHLPPEGNPLFPELYQAADKIDLDKLAQSPNLDNSPDYLVWSTRGQVLTDLEGNPTLLQDENEIIWAITGQNQPPKLILEHTTPEEPKEYVEVYTCRGLCCGHIFKNKTWVGQCPVCGKWNTVELVEVCWL